MSLVEKAEIECVRCHKRTFFEVSDAGRLIFDGEGVFFVPDVRDADIISPSFCRIESKVFRKIHLIIGRCSSNDRNFYETAGRHSKKNRKTSKSLKKS